MLNIFTSKNQISIIKTMLPNHQNNLWVRSKKETLSERIIPNDKILNRFTPKNKKNAKRIILIRFLVDILGMDKFSINKR